MTENKNGLKLSEDFCKFMEVDGGTRQSMRVSSGSIFEKEFAKKLQEENPNAIVERGVRVEESERKTKYHKVDIVLIDKQASKVVQYELKSQKGIPSFVCSGSAYPPLRTTMLSTLSHPYICLS
jgi:hypothetical protein